MKPWGSPLLHSCWQEYLFLLGSSQLRYVQKALCQSNIENELHLTDLSEETCPDPRAGYGLQCRYEEMHSGKVNGKLTEYRPNGVWVLCWILRPQHSAEG